MGTGNSCYSDNRKFRMGLRFQTNVLFCLRKVAVVRLRLSSLHVTLSTVEREKRVVAVTCSWRTFSVALSVKI